MWKKRLAWLVVCCVLMPASAALAQGPEEGAAGAGDLYFPQSGNGGYDALNYTLDLTVDVAANVLDGTATIELQPTQELSAFNFDLSGLAVEAVTVNDVAAEFTHQDGELLITPAAALAAGETATVVIDYGGTPEPVFELALGGAPLGWVAYEGGIYVTSEPMGSNTWYPVNNHPSDKATYTYRVTVPKPYEVAANGVRQDIIDNGTTTTTVWVCDDPMASYLATVVIAEMDEDTSVGPHGLPIRNFLPADDSAEVPASLSRQSEMIELFEEAFGPYPFDAYGIVALGGSLSFALETQTLSIFGLETITDDLEAYPGILYAEIIVGHELAHQWYGDAVALDRWQDIWLNEGFASYAEVLLVEHFAGAEAAQKHIDTWYTTLETFMVLRADDATALDAYEAFQPTFEQYGQEVTVETFAQFLGLTADVLETTPFRDVSDKLGVDASMLEPLKIGDPGADNLFAMDVYYRGGLTLHALRLTVGDEAFFNILRAYYERYNGGNATTEDFIAVAEEISGQELDSLFEEWLYTDGLPVLPEA